MIVIAETLQMLPIDALIVAVDKDAGLKDDTFKLEALSVDADKVVVVMFAGLKFDAFKLEKFPVLTYNGFKKRTCEVEILPFKLEAI